MAVFLEQVDFSRIRGIGYAQLTIKAGKQYMIIFFTWTLSTHDR